MNKNGNTYTLIFASAMVIIVALLLSFTHEALKGTQDRNGEIDKMSQILRSIKITDIDNKDVETKYKEIITDVFLIDAAGNIIPNSSKEAFDINMKNEMEKPIDNRRFPIFIANIDGEKKYIMQLDGKGLWGAIWGYISVNADGNSIYGADFSHSGETPGLGAEITHSSFSNQFTDKHLFKNGTFKSVAVVKKGKTTIDQDYVDGISGGTITGNGVEKMLYNSLEGYSKYLSKIEKK